MFMKNDLYNNHKTEQNDDGNEYESNSSSLRSFEEKDMETSIIKLGSQNDNKKKNYDDLYDKDEEWNNIIKLKKFEDLENTIEENIFDKNNDSIHEQKEQYREIRAFSLDRKNIRKGKSPLKSNSKFYQKKFGTSNILNNNNKKVRKSYNIVNGNDKKKMIYQ